MAKLDSKVRGVWMCMCAAWRALVCGMHGGGGFAWLSLVTASMPFFVSVRLFLSSRFQRHRLSARVRSREEARDGLHDARQGLEGPSRGACSCDFEMSQWLLCCSPRHNDVCISFQLSREQWQEVLDLAQCSILSQMSNE